MVILDAPAHPWERAPAGSPPAPLSWCPGRGYKRTHTATQQPNQSRSHDQHSSLDKNKLVRADLLRRLASSNNNRGWGVCSHEKNCLPLHLVGKKENSKERFEPKTWRGYPLERITEKTIRSLLFFLRKKNVFMCRKHEEILHVESTPSNYPTLWAVFSRPITMVYRSLKGLYSSLMSCSLVDRFQSLSAKYLSWRD